MTGYDIMSFGSLLKMFRKRAHTTQQQLADAIGMHRHAIIRWEQGELLPASKTTVLELARCLRLADTEARLLLEASLKAPDPLWGVPFPRNLLFTGREEILEELHAHLRVIEGNEQIQISALHGLGGVGKTQIALEYAYRYALEYRAVLWIEAENIERIYFSLQHIAGLLQLPELAATDQRLIVRAVLRWLSIRPQWLLIWDNLVDLDLPLRMFPSSRQGAFLFTTRAQALGALAHGIFVPPLEFEESLLLLLRRAKVLGPEATHTQAQHLVGRRPAEYEAAAELARLLGGLPLALDQAGAYLEEIGCSFPDYLQRFEKQRAAFLQRRGKPSGAHPASVATTFLLALAQAQQEQEAAVDLLRVCALLHGEAIPLELFEKGAAHLGPTLESVVADPGQFSLVLAALRNLSLIQRNTEARTISLHQLVQVVTREQMAPAEVELWSKRVILMINAAFPTVDFATWPDCERLLAQALICVSLIEQAGSHLPEASELLQKAGCYLLERGRLTEAEPLLKQAIALGEQYYGPDHPLLLPLLKSQEELFWRQGKYACAETLASRMLAIEERHLEPTHIHIADTLNILALVYLCQGKYAQAEPLFLRALQIWKQHNHQGQRVALNNLARLYGGQGKYAQAESLLQQAIENCERVLGTEHPEIAFGLNSLGIIYCEQGKYEQAEPLFLRALRIREQILGTEHLFVAISLSQLAVLYREQNKYEQAEPLFLHALRIREQFLDAMHPEIARSQAALANLYQSQGKTAQAELVLHRA